MYLKRYYDQEIWKEVTLKSPFEEKFKLYVSNYGQIKKYSKISAKETILRQPLTEGYPSFNISFVGKITIEEQEYFSTIRKHIDDLKKVIKELMKELSLCDGKNALYYDLLKKIEENQSLLDTIKTNYRAKYKSHEIKRKKTYGSLTHRLVALHFLEKPREDQKFVAHLDFDKTNNHHSNLKWMSQVENSEHQRKSPYVIKAKEKAILEPRISNQKLSESQVMIIKKRINEDVPLRKLAKRFKISETQLLRIKRGINWKNTPAAR